MPRKPRELFDGGIYHVFNRGNDRRTLFGKENDYLLFLATLDDAVRYFSANLHHYCLMPNHFHLLFKIQKKDDLSALMHRLQLSYARYFKKTREFNGHVFQERFRSPLIAQESYFLQCGRYIERNPVRAHLVQNAVDYPYSSAGFYIHGTKNSRITPNPYYEQLGLSDRERQQRYSEFLAFDDPYTTILNKALAEG